MSETELSKGYEPSDFEGKWYRHWEERGYFRADPSSKKPPYSIVLPPPNVTGSLHLGHAVPATLQDVLIRWKRMEGFDCLWVPGVDHAGIATQMMVERHLKASEGITRHDLGRERFLERVWAWKNQYGTRIDDQHKMLGVSLDWSRHRFTMDEGISAAVRKVFVNLFQDELAYRAERLINWCPSCRTALSDLEVEHEEQAGALWHLRYPVEGSDRQLVIATTRPETMLGDTAVAVHPDDPRYEGLVGKRVGVPLTDRTIPIVADAELVDMEFGTGVVKVTPAHDFNDYQTGLRHDLPRLRVIDEQGTMTPEAGVYAGLDRFEARARIVADLQAQEVLEKEEPHRHAVGSCQRCRTVVEPMLSPQWFVKAGVLAEPAIRAVEEGKTKILPETWVGVYEHWMKNIQDWCVSRQLWWGHQIPAWYCRSCEGIAEGAPIPLTAKPIVSEEAPSACPRCGGAELVRDPDVLDTWFSSGLWPFATLGWPEETPELAKYYPTAVLETGHDILFFWVARMMMMGLYARGEVPFRHVYLHAMVRDDKGEKMSKTKGNVIDPIHVVEGAAVDLLTPSLRNRFPEGMPPFGADALRFTLAALTQQGRNVRLSFEQLAGYKAFANKLWNASRFALMNLDAAPEGGQSEADAASLLEGRTLSVPDRWILSRLDRAVEETRAALERFEFADAASAVYQFLWRELCDWFIELAKVSFNGDDPAARETAGAVLLFTLDRVLRLLHPFMPFITEEIWQRLPVKRETESIMIASYPKPDPRLRDEDAEAAFEPLLTCVEGIRSVRGESMVPPSRKLRAVVHVADVKTRASLQEVAPFALPLAGLTELEVVAPGPKPPMSAAFVSAGLEVFVPLEGVIDLEEERRRLGKELARVQGDLSKLSKKLENPRFVERAPADVVAKDRARVAELEGMAEKLSAGLERLSGGPGDGPDGGGSAGGGGAPGNGSSKAGSSKAGASGAAASARSPSASASGKMRKGAPIADADTAKVRIQSDGGDGTFDLGAELGAELEGGIKAVLKAAPKGKKNTRTDAGLPRGEAVDTSKVDPQIREALEVLRSGTEEGLSSEDHRELGAAYMSMGLVEEAAREFREADEGDIRLIRVVDPDEAPAARHRGRAHRQPAPPRPDAPKRRGPGKKPDKGPEKKKGSSAPTTRSATKGTVKPSAALKGLSDKVKAVAKKASPKTKAAAKKTPVALKTVPTVPAKVKATAKRAPVKLRAVPAPPTKTNAKASAKQPGAMLKAAVEKAPATVRAAVKKASAKMKAGTTKAPPKPKQASTKKAAVELKAAAKKAPAKVKAAATEPAVKVKAAVKKAPAKKPGGKLKAAVAKAPAKVKAAAAKPAVKVKAAVKKAPAKKPGGKLKAAVAKAPAKVKVKAAAKKPAVKVKAAVKKASAKLKPSAKRPPAVKVKAAVKKVSAKLKPSAKRPPAVKVKAAVKKASTKLKASAKRPAVKLKAAVKKTSSKSKSTASTKAPSKRPRIAAKKSPPRRRS